MTPIEKAIAKLGGQTAAARALEVSGYQVVQQWIAQGRVPADYCPRIEHLTGVRCEDLNGRVEWALIRGTAPAAAPTAPTHACIDHAAELRGAIAQTRIVFESEPVVDGALNYLEAVLASAPAGAAVPPPNADDLTVDHFAAEMKKHMVARRTLGYGDWYDPAEADVEDLLSTMIDRLQLGDLVGVACAAMTSHTRGATAEQAAQALKDATAPALPGSFKSADELFVATDAGTTAPIARRQLADGIASTRRLFADHAAAQAALDRLEFCMGISSVPAKPGMDSSAADSLSSDYLDLVLSIGRVDADVAKESPAGAGDPPAGTHWVAVSDSHLGEVFELIEKLNAGAGDRAANEPPTKTIAKLVADIDTSAATVALAMIEQLKRATDSLTALGDLGAALAEFARLLAAAQEDAARAAVGPLAMLSREVFGLSNKLQHPADLVVQLMVLDELRGLRAERGGHSLSSAVVPS